MGAYVDVTTIAVSVELVVATNIHAVVVGVQSAHLEVDIDNVRDGTSVLDPPALVVADYSGPFARVGVVLPHQRSCLLREGLASRRPVLQRNQLLEQGVENLADSKTSVTRLATDNLGSGALVLALVQRDLDGVVDDLDRLAVLPNLLILEKIVGSGNAYADSNTEFARHGIGFGNGSRAGNGGDRKNEGNAETHFDKDGLSLKDCKSEWMMSGAGSLGGCWLSLAPSYWDLYTSTRWYHAVAAARHGGAGISGVWP